MSAAEVVNYAPIAAAAFAIPQFVPQIIKVRATHDARGVSWSWATQTSINNAAWFVYFVLSMDWTALVPAFAATVSAGMLAAMLATRRQGTTRAAVLTISWIALLVAVWVVAGRLALGTLLTAAFVAQVAPSIWTAYRTKHPTGISSGTWLLILAELGCWAGYGFHKSDPRLIVLGLTGVSASALMLARVYFTRTPALRDRN